MKTKTIFISAFFLFASALCLRAQGVFEYASVTYSWNGVNTYYIGISTGDNYTEAKVESKFESKGSFNDLTPLLEKVNELAKEGWEVYSTSSIMMGGPVNSYLTYHLRRKKP